MKKKRFTVTLAVCAYNEEGNIDAFLRSVLKQTGKSFTLNRVIVVSDGSVDNTVHKIQLIEDVRIQLWNSKKRKGKSYWLNQIYRNTKSELLVQSDADVVFGSTHVIEKIITPLLRDKSVSMCGGNPIPLPAETFIEQAVNITTRPYAQFRRLIRRGNNIFSADGRLLAFRKSFIKSIRIPATMIANDAFVYFCCITTGRRYCYVPQAVVLYRSPQTMNDQIRQNSRFLAAPQRMAKYFNKDVIRCEYHIPPFTYLRSVLSQALRYPVHSIVIFLLNRFCAINGALNEKRFTGRWEIAVTTKQFIGNQ